MEGLGGETTIRWLELTTKQAWHKNIQTLGLLITPSKAIQHYNVHTTEFAQIFSVCQKHILKK